MCEAVLCRDAFSFDDLLFPVEGKRTREGEGDGGGEGAADDEHRTLTVESFFPWPPLILKL